MSCTRKQIVAQAQSWIGCKESDGSHKKIIDVYNSHKPRARGYKLSYTDPWCAGFTSACAIACKATDIIPLEVGVGKLITLAKKMGIWVEADDYDPLPGDLVVYYWNAKKTGDQKTGASHVGFIETSNNKKYTVIEGNYSNSVKRRSLKNNDYRIRGFITPNYDACPDEAEEVPAVAKKVAVELRELKKGDTGDDVLVLQILLRGHCCNGNMNEKLDGIFGKNTNGAVELFQKKNGLEVDGIVGVKTWGKLLGTS